MEHCVHNTEEEIKMLRDKGVYAAHCIHSNLDIMRGVMQLRRYLDEGIRVGLGSDFCQEELFECGEKVFGFRLVDG